MELLAWSYFGARVYTTQLFGANVTHPLVGENRKLNIAALVSSVEAHTTAYSAMFRNQQARKDSPVNFYTTKQGSGLSGS